MRIWDVPPSELCRQHLLGEHRELHAIWTILTEDRDGYRNHPEVKRWEGKLPALAARHQGLVVQMRERSYNHGSPLDAAQMSGHGSQFEYVDSPDEQRRILREKDCDCLLDVREHSEGGRV